MTLKDDDRLREYQRFMDDYDETMGTRLAGCLGILFAFLTAAAVCGILVMCAGN